MTLIEPVQQVSADTLLDKEQGLIDNLLLRFRNIISLAPSPKDVSKEAAAVSCYQMKVETDSLIRSGEDLLSLSRQLKELWLAGQLRDLDGAAIRNGEEDSAMNRDAREVLRLAKKMMDKIKDES